MTIIDTTRIAIQHAPEAEEVITTWGEFKANNSDAFTADDFAALAADLIASADDGEPAFAGWSMVWIAA